MARNSPQHHVVKPGVYLENPHLLYISHLLLHFVIILTNLQITLHLIYGIEGTLFFHFLLCAHHKIFIKIEYNFFLIFP